MPAEAANFTRGSLLDDKQSRRFSLPPLRNGSNARYSGSDLGPYEDYQPLLRKPSPTRSKQRTLRISTDISILGKKDKLPTGSLSRALVSPVYKTIYPITPKDVNTCLSPVYKTIYPRTEDEDGTVQSPIYETIYPRHARRCSGVPKSPICKTLRANERKINAPPLSPTSPLCITIKPRAEKESKCKNLANDPDAFRIVMFRDGQQKITCTKGHTTWLTDSATKRGGQKCTECEFEEDIKASRAKLRKMQRRNSTSSYTTLGLKKTRDGYLEFVRGVRDFDVPRSTNFLDTLLLKPSSTYGKVGGGYTRFDKPERGLDLGVR
ncbi:hypothetical protein AJ79_05010 [Helicocarpus griseus UAMH5409]|uniref:Uncharacterized protein n=1 Tax=Helicocarpus griseus UAMH5409 TaxID=1447875 RepID=A0A2B7XRD6_9EURO|nr:hypothetical protein AJ79_05010 [Helicocarpus griseus UAMH5409]